MQKRVVLFTSPHCTYCTQAKGHFLRNKIQFKTIDISKEPRAKADCEKHGCRGVPVILVGSRWICGFDRQKIDRELNIK